MNETLSLYHQSCVDTARKRLNYGGSLTELPKEFIGDSRLNQIWGEKPVFISTSRHALIDPESRYLSIDHLTDLLLKDIGGVQINNLVWESHPIGLESIKLDISNGLVGRKVPNTPQWGKPHPAALEALYELAIPENINTARDQFINEAKSFGADSQKVEEAEERATDTFSQLQCILSKAEQSSLSLTQVCLNWESWLRERSNYPIKTSLQIQPLSESIVHQQIIDTLSLVANTIGLENLFDRLLEQGQGNLFAGSREELLTKIGFSKNNRRFEIVYQNPVEEKKIGKPKPITSSEILNLLQNREVIATGKAATCALTLASTQTSVVYFGNSHKEFNNSKRALGIQDTKGLLQITEDWKDSWPILQIKHQDQIITPRMTTLYIWLGDKAFDYFAKTLSSGEPIVLDPEEYYKI